MVLRRPEKEAGGSHHPLARFMGSSSSALFELVIFQPLDTCCKRIITHQGRLLTAEGLSLTAKYGKIRSVVFREKLHSGPIDKLRSLYAGLKFGAYYKICQRTAAYGLQPFVFDYIHAYHHEDFVSLIGSKRARALEFATAAAVMGTAEVIFIPLDTLKILSQTNPASLRSRSFLQLVRQEGFRLYRGASWTVLRNFPGSFALFGGSALVKEKVFHLDQYKDATLLQELLASCTGAVWSLTLSSPADVIKARVQRACLSPSHEGTQTKGREILREMLKKEGPWALFKGLNTKFMVVCPKLVLSFTVYNQVMSWLDAVLEARDQ